MTLSYSSAVSRASIKASNSVGTFVPGVPGTFPEICSHAHEIDRNPVTAAIQFNTNGTQQRKQLSHRIINDQQRKFAAFQ